MIVDSIKEDVSTDRPYGLIYEVRETIRSGGRESRRGSLVPASPSAKGSSTRELRANASSAAEQARWVTSATSEKAKTQQFSSNI